MATSRCDIRTRMSFEIALNQRRVEEEEEEEEERSLLDDFARATTSDLLQ
jgi:hypothetical protein